MPMIPLAARAGRWSASHRRAVVLGWLALVVLTYAIGSAVGTVTLRAGRRLGGISIHRRLLDAATVADLRARAELLLTWPVAGPEDASRLAAWGVDGVITERFEALAA